MIINEESFSYLYNRFGTFSFGQSIANKIIKTFIKLHTNSNTAIQEIASNLDINERTLRRKCAEFFRLTPNELLTIIRLFHAEKLLKEQVKVSEVWSRVGFSSHSYFSDVFKQNKNLTPQKYAKQHKYQNIDDQPQKQKQSQNDKSIGLNRIKNRFLDNSIQKQR